MPVINCKKCSKIFEKRLSDLCADCLKIDDENFRTLYRLLQKSATMGGVAISDLSDEVGIPVEEIEQMFLEGRFSTAGAMLKFPCQTCGVLVGSWQRKGRFCISCSEKTAQQAGVEVKSKTALLKQAEEEHQQQQQAALLRKNRSSTGVEKKTFTNRRSGMGSRHKH